MKIAFFFNEEKFCGKLTKFFTGCYCYHVGFVDEERDILYDMNLTRRKRRWSIYGSRKNAILVEAPVEITADYLEEQLLVDDSLYGVADYSLFMLRPMYHWFGKSTRNVGGMICSELVYNGLYAHGWSVKFPEVPSPCDLYRLLG